MDIFYPSATPKALPAVINSWCGTKVRHIFAPGRRTPHCDDDAAPRAKPRRAAFVCIRPAAIGDSRGARPNEAPRFADIQSTGTSMLHIEPFAARDGAANEALLDRAVVPGRL